MYRVKHPTASPTKPAKSSTGTVGYFAEGTPDDNPPSTYVPADWLNTIQDEIGNVVLGADIVLSENDDTQLLQAITALIDSRLALISLWQVGDIKMRAMDDNQEGWLPMDGEDYLVSAYPALAAFLGAPYSLSGGRFFVPDWRGLFLRCHDSRTARQIGSYEADGVKLPALSCTITNSGAWVSTIDTTAATLTHAQITTSTNGGVDSQTLGTQSSSHSHNVPGNSGQNLQNHYHSLHMHYETVNRWTIGNEPRNVISSVGGNEPGSPAFLGGQTQENSVNHNHAVGVEASSHSHFYTVPAIAAHNHIASIPNHAPHNHQVTVTIPDHGHTATVTGASQSETTVKNRTMMMYIRAI